VRIENVTKKFGDFVAVNNVSLKIYKGEIFCLLGGRAAARPRCCACWPASRSRPAAASSSTAGHGRHPALRAAGEHDVPVLRAVPAHDGGEERRLRPGAGALPRAEIRQRVGRCSTSCSWASSRKRKPHQLSGGQRQRVALARALVKRPKLLLLDEPLGALDKKLREHTQFELINIQEQLGVTFIVVTHDQEEAMTLASRIGVMNRGEIVQVGTPTEIYEFPNTRFVADFIGSVNMFEGRLIEDEPDRVRIQSTGTRAA
jgi:putrescine transport system ATP-binding protein